MQIVIRFDGKLFRCLGAVLVACAIAFLVLAAPPRAAAEKKDKLKDIVADLEDAVVDLQVCVTDLKARVDALEAGGGGAGPPDALADLLQEAPSTWSMSATYRVRREGRTAREDYPFLPLLGFELCLGTDQEQAIDDIFASPETFLGDSVGFETFEDFGTVTFTPELNTHSGVWFTERNWQPPVGELIDCGFGVFDVFPAFPTYSVYAIIGDSLVMDEPLRGTPIAFESARVLDEDTFVVRCDFARDREWTIPPESARFYAVSVTFKRQP